MNRARNLTATLLLAAITVSCSGGSSGTGGGGPAPVGPPPPPSISSGPASSGGVIFPGNHVDLFLTALNAITYEWCAIALDATSPGFFTGGVDPLWCTGVGKAGATTATGAARWNAPIHGKMVEIQVKAIGPGGETTVTKSFTVALELGINTIANPLSGLVVVSGTLGGHSPLGTATVSSKVGGESLPSLNVLAAPTTEITSFVANGATILPVGSSLGFLPGNRIRVRDGVLSPVEMIIRCTDLLPDLALTPACLALPPSTIMVEVPIDVTPEAGILNDGFDDVWQLQDWSMDSPPWDTTAVPSAGDGTYGLAVTATDAIGQQALQTRTVTIANAATGGGSVLVTSPKNNAVLNRNTGDPIVDFSAVVDPSLTVSAVQFFVDAQFACEDTDGTDPAGWSCPADVTYDPIGDPGGFNPVAGTKVVVAKAITPGSIFDSTPISFDLLNCGVLLTGAIAGTQTWTFDQGPFFVNRDLLISGDLTIDTVTNNPGANPIYIRMLQPAGFNPLGVEVSGSINTIPAWPAGNPVVIEPVTVGAHYVTGLPENGFCPSDSNPPADPNQPPLVDTAAKGDWGQVKFAAGSTGAMGKLFLRYGGGQSTIVAPPLEGGLIIESSSPVLRDLSIEFVQGDGLRVDGSPLATQPDIDFLEIEGADGFAVVMHPSFTGLGTTTDFIDNGVDAVNVNTGSIPQAMGVVNWPSVTGSYVVSGNIGVEAGATLILDPGAVVKFTSVQSGFSSSGRLEFGTPLSGVPGEPVILTDFDDDTAGVFGPIDCGTPAGMGEPVCDTNGDGLSVGSPGAWDQVRFGIGASGFLDNAEVRFAGSDSTDGAVHVQSASLRDGSDAISGNLDDCDDLTRATDGPGGFKDGTTGSCVVLSEVFITDAGGHGIVVDGQPDTYPVLRESVITATAIYPVRQIPSYTGLSDIQNDYYAVRNRICPWDSGLGDCLAAAPADAYQGIALMLGRVEAGETASVRRMSRGDGVSHVASTDMPYVVTQDIAIEAGGILSIAPDSFLKFAGQSAGISASGTLCGGAVWSTGTLSCDPLGGTGALFTSLAADNLLGEGDTNGDGASSPAPGDWRGIDFSSTSDDSALLFSRVRYAGDGLGAGVLVDGTLVLVQDNEITDASGHAIEVRGDLAELIDGSGADLTRLGIRRNVLERNTEAPLSIPVFASVCGHDAFLSGCAAGGTDQNIIPSPGGVDSNGVSGIDFHSLGTTTIPGGMLNPVSWPTVCFAAAAACSPPAGTSVPYVISTLVTVAEGAELILDEGLVAKIDGTSSGLLVNGSLTAATGALLDGPVDIVFTSLFDDDFDGDGVANATGDTDGAGPSLGAPGDWASLSFVRTPTAVGCPASYPISHPGAAPITGPCGRVFGASLLYGGFGSRGINPGDLLDDGNLVVDTADAILFDGLRTGFSAENGAVFLINEQDGGLPGTFPIVQDSTFESNRAYPVAAHPSLGVASLCDSRGWGVNGVDEFGLGDDCPDNTFMIDPGAAALTEFFGIALTGGTIRNTKVGPDATWSLNLEDATGDPLAVFITADVAVSVGAELAVNDGTVIKMGDPFPYDAGNGPELANTGVDMLVEGVLSARGTGPSPVVFTSVSDDCMGSIDPVTAACTGAAVVDSNRDLFTTGSRGDWGSLRVRTQISGLLSDLRVLYGGGGIWGGAVFVSGPSQASAIFTLADAEIAYSGSHGLSGINDFNLDVLPGTTIHHNTGRGISMSDSPFSVSGSPVNPTKIQNNDSDGVYVEFTQDPVVDGVIVQDNGGWGIYVFGGDSDPAVGSCPFLQPFPNIISSSDTTQVLRNGLGGVRFENVFDFVLSGAEINENGYGASVTGVDDGHGVDFVLNDPDDVACPPPAQTRGEMLNNTVNQNAWRGVAVRNERQSITSNLLTPNILNNHIERNTGGGIFVKHTGPFLFSNEIWNNTSEVVPGTTDQGVGHGLFVHLDRPDSVGLPITGFSLPNQMSGDDSGKHSATEPVVQSNDFRDNSPYQARVPASVEMGDHPNRPQGNTFLKTPADTLPCVAPCVRNAVQIYGWLIRDEFTNDTAVGTSDPDSATGYPATITPDTAWGPLSGSTGGVPLAGTVPYILANDVVVMPMDGGTPGAVDGANFSPVYLQVSNAIVKITEPEDPSWSQVAVDFHNHSLLVMDDSFVVSFHDDSRGGQQDFDTPEFGVINRPAAPGDWGGIRFYDGALDFWESWLSVDTVCEGTSTISGSFGGGTMYPGGFGEVPTFNENPCFGWTDHPHTYEGTTTDDDEECGVLCDWYPNASFSASGAASMISRLFNTVVDSGGDGLEGMVWVQRSSPLLGFSDFDNSLVYGMYLDGDNNNNSLGALTQCAGPFCSIPYNNRGVSTHPRAQVTSAGNLSGDCLFVRGGGTGLVSGVTCTPF